MPVFPTSWKVKSGESFEPGSLRPAWKHKETLSNQVAYMVSLANSFHQWLFSGDRCNRFGAGSSHRTTGVGKVQYCTLILPVTQQMSLVPLDFGSSPFTLLDDFRHLSKFHGFSSVSVLLRHLWLVRI